MAKTSSYKSVALIDEDVLKEIFEYLVKERASDLGSFSINRITFDIKNMKWVAGILSANEPGTKDFCTNDSGEKFRIVARLEGRDKQPPMENFRKSRKIGEKMEEAFKNMEESFKFGEIAGNLLKKSLEPIKKISAKKKVV